MQHPLYQYVSKDDRPLAVEIEFESVSTTPKHLKAYCHIEERFRPICKFDFFKISDRGFVPHAVCRECLDHGYELGAIYRKCGMIKAEVKLYQRGVIINLL
jgi:hypothetical protein